jgi:peptidyl-prolyl cis-trans isomerase B (cyclophilin B)
MKKLIYGCLFAFALSVVTTQAEEPKKEEPKKEEKKEEKTTSTAKEVAVVKTTAGEMVIEFWPDVAPKTVENFKKLANKGFYDGTAFHRIIKGFMIQGGDPNTKDPKADPRSFGQGGPGYTIADEFHNRPHARGVISMAHTRAPNSAGSQFFICLDEQSTAQLNGKYAAFGKLIKGDDVLEKIANSPVTGPNSMGEFSIPKDRIAIESIKIVPADSVK